MRDPALTRYNKELVKGCLRVPLSRHKCCCVRQPAPRPKTTSSPPTVLVLATVSGVSQVGAPTVSSDGLAADFQVTLNGAPESDAALETVRDPLRSTAHWAAPAGTTAVVGGISSVYADFQDAMTHDYTIVFQRS